MGISEAEYFALKPGDFVVCKPGSPSARVLLVDPNDKSLRVFVEGLGSTPIAALNAGRFEYTKLPGLSSECGDWAEIREIDRVCPAPVAVFAPPAPPPPEPAPATPEHDPVNRPAHYTSHPSGVEAIQVSEHMTFCTGNVIKYLWRAGLKGNDEADRRVKAIEDMKKARWYLDREIARLEAAAQAEGLRGAGSGGGG